VSTRVSKAAAIARNEATAALLRGGTLSFYAGEPAGPDEPAGERPCLVKLALADSPLSVRAEQARVIARGIAKATVERDGTPTWWRAHARNGDAVLTGRVATGEEADAIIKLAGDTQEPAQSIAVKPAKLWRGMEFAMPEIALYVGGLF